jgi:DNA (cytosine-5)-methyltransferase 1
MSLAVDGMGWKPVFFSEIEPFPCQLLKTRFPHVPNLGDMTKIEGEKYVGSVDVLAGGTPCQSFSVAGKRGGIEDGRGQLMLNFVRLAYETGAKWCVWENVPGVFSSNQGEDYAALLSCLCGVDVTVPAKGWKNSGVVTNADGCYGVAWRVLDAQYTRVPGFPLAVPQRRRRVWLVGYLGDWRRAAEVLFVGEGLPWNFEAGERAGQEAAGSVTDRAGTASGQPFTASSFGVSAEGVGTVRAAGGNLPLVKVNPIAISDVVHGDKACNGKGWNDEGASYTLDTMATQGVCFQRSELRLRGSLTPLEVSPTLMAGCKEGDNELNVMQTGTCFQQNTRDEVRLIGGDGNIAGCVSAQAGMKQQNYINQSLVRRLLPIETEKLMGFPPGWTDIRPNGKPTPDSPRYKACGNSWAVNCARWVMMRIQQSEDKYT